MKPLILILSLLVPVAVSMADETVSLTKKFALNLEQTSDAQAPAKLFPAAPIQTESDMSEPFPKRIQRYRHYVELLRAFPGGRTRAQLYAVLPPLSAPWPSGPLTACGAGVSRLESYPIDADYEVVVPILYRPYFGQAPTDIVCDTPQIQARPIPASGPNITLQ